MEEAPVFDETKPYELVALDEAPAFDPNATFEEITTPEDIKPIVDVPKELTKEELVQKEYDQKINLIDTQVLKIKDMNELDEETKKSLYDGLEIKKTTLAKQKQDEVDKLNPTEEKSSLFNSLSNFGSSYATGISSTDNTNKKEDITDYQTNLYLAGAKRPALGLARAVVTNTDKLGLTDDATNSVLEYIQENESDINKIMKENKIDVNSINSADIGQFISENLPITKLAGLFKISAGAGVTAGLGEYGKGEDAVSSVVKGVGTGAVSLVGGKAIEFVAPRVISAVKGISIEANKLGAKLGMTPEEVAIATKGVPKEQQTLVLAQSQGQDALGVYKQAIRDSDELRIKLSNDIQARTGKVNNAALAGEFDKVKDYTEKAWKIMESEVNKSGIVVNASSLTENIGKTKLFSGIDETAKNKIVALENRILDNPELPLGDILTIRKQINRELGKSKGTPAYEYYDKLKTNLDELVADNVPKEYSKLIDDTHAIYKDTMNQESLLAILDKASSKEEVSGYSKQAIDYNKAMKLIKEEKLSGTVVEQTVNTLKELDKKFNTDYAMIKSTLPKGSNPNEGPLGIWGEIIGTIKKNFWRVGESGDNMYIQNAIEKAIKKGNNPIEYLDNIIKSKDVPQEIKKTMISNVKDMKNFNKAEANRLKMIEANMKSQSFLGMGKSYGGKATKPKTTTSGSEDISSSLYGTKKEHEELKRVVDRFGIEGTNKANTTSYENGAKEWYSSLTNKQKEEVVSIVEAKKDRTGGYNLTDVYEQQIKSYGKSKDGNPSYNDISESLFGTQKKTKDTSGNLGMTSKYGEKATGTGGVNTKEAKDYLNRFMDDIANPKVTVDTNKINDLYGALKSEGTTMYGATTAKEKAWEDAMDIVNKMRNKNSVTPKEREQMIQAVKKYHSLINSTI